MRQRRGWAAAVREWHVWKLRAWLRAYVLATIAAGAAALAAAALLTTWHAGSLRLFGVLLLGDLVTVELTRRQHEPGGGLIKEVHAMWELPIALLLPPVFALLAPIARMALTQWRVRKALLYRRVFSMFALGLSYATGSVAFHRLAPPVTAMLSEPSSHINAWVAAAIASGVLRSAVNKLLVETAVKGGDPTASIRDDLLNGQALFDDLAELSAGLFVAFAGTSSLWLVPFGLPVSVLLQRSMRHRQLVSESRRDGLTELLNKKTWTREATVLVTRSRQAALLFVDIDYFKRVNRVVGHQGGDAVLAAVAKIIKETVRPYDLVGRYGGEEFAILLPRTSQEKAREIAGRLRLAIAEATFQVDSIFVADDVLRVTVSIGVAALNDAATVTVQGTVGESHDLDYLLKDADLAMYRAKELGRNKVCTVDELG
jgi:diguanylate cyclase (GGDEF)-like protein